MQKLKKRRIFYIIDLCVLLFSVIMMIITGAGKLQTREEMLGSGWFIFSFILFCISLFLIVQVTVVISYFKGKDKVQK